MKVPTRALLIVAGIVWLVAGINIAVIGIGSYFDEQGTIVVLLALGSIAAFLVFHLFVFNKMVEKHALRIQGYQEAKTAIYRFFDVKGYLVMAIMMGGGIGLRLSGVIPEWFIASFYTGLGCALGLAGVSFLLRYWLACSATCPFVRS